MIINALVNRYEATQEIPPGWQRREASYALELSESGEFLGVMPLGNPGDKNPRLTLTLPSTGSGRSGKNAYETSYFLCDDGSYMFGLDPRKFTSAQKLHTELLSNIDTPPARAICAYFKSGLPALPQGMDEKEAQKQKFIFMVDGRRIDYDDCGAEIRQAWEKWEASHKSGGERKRCLVSGKYDTVIKLHDKVELRGVSMGKTPLISMNDQTSFRSYGATPKDPPAQIGTETAFAYVTALNDLLRNEKHRQFIGGDTLVYWAENGNGAEEEVFSWTSQIKEDDADKLESLIKKAAAGRLFEFEGCNLDSRFHLLCLSPNSGRISVRFFHTDSFGSVLNNNIAHYQRLEIYKAGNDRFRHLPIWMILNETTVKKQATDVTPLLGGQFYKSIITGGRYPMTLYQAILNRIRAGEDVNKVKAAVIKAVLMRNYDEKEVTTVALNTHTSQKPYVLGRLFSVIEQLQQRASGGGLNATIRDRYFARACANPASVFPTLLRLSVHHAAKLDNSIFYEKLKTELLGKLDVQSAFPPVLNLDDQGRFILGYYHQTQEFFTAKKDKGEQDNV